SHHGKSRPADLVAVFIAGAVHEPDLLNPLAIICPTAGHQRQVCSFFYGKEQLCFLFYPDVAAVLLYQGDRAYYPGSVAKVDRIVSNERKFLGGRKQFVEFFPGFMGVIIELEDSPSTGPENPDHYLVEKNGTGGFYNTLIDIDVGGLAADLAQVIVPDTGRFGHAVVVFMAGASAKTEVDRIAIFLSLERNPSMFSGTSACLSTSSMVSTGMIVTIDLYCSSIRTSLMFIRGMSTVLIPALTAASIL